MAIIIITICTHVRASCIIVHKIIISAFLAILGMPIEMYGERRRRDLQACRPNMQYMAGLRKAQGMRWRLNYIHSMKYAEVINVSIAANSAGIDYSTKILTS